MYAPLVLLCVLWPVLTPSLLPPLCLCGSPTRVYSVFVAGPQLDDLCYHAGLQFLTAHAAFGLMMERALQAVNPRVSLPFWDYMIEAETLGTE